MKIAIILCILFCAVGIKSQCVVPSGYVCITQSDSDRISKDLAELKASRDVIAKFASERLMTDAEKAASKTLIDAITAAFDARGKIVADQAMIIDIQAKALTLYSTLVDKLTAQINKPKSAWQKFAQTLKEIALIATGLAIGAHL